MNELDDLLARRAERARSPHDTDTTVALVAARAAHGARRRRNRLTIASGTAVVVAAATVGLVIADSGNAPHRPAPDEAGRPGGPAVVSSGTLATILPVVRPLHGSARGHALPVQTVEHERAARQRAAARQQQRLIRLRREAKARRHRTSGSDTTLVPAKPAPPSAEISIGLLPEGFQYLSLDDADTYYGTPGTAPTDYFSAGIVVDVHDFIGDDTDYTLTVDGKPAAYSSSDGFTMVRVRYSKTVDIGFQAPPAADLTEAQALQMAASLDVRSTAHLTHG